MKGEAHMTGGRVDDDARVLDPDAVQALWGLLDGDGEAMAELVEAFLAEAPERLAELRQAAQRGDEALARRAAHTLKSNALTFGAAGFAADCRRIEAAAAEGRLAGCEPQIHGLEAGWPVVKDQVTALVERSRR